MWQRPWRHQCGNQTWTQEMGSGFNTFNLTTRNNTLISNGLKGVCAMNVCSSINGQTCQRSKILQRSGCGLTTMTYETCHWAGLLLCSGWQWLSNVSNYPALAKRDAYDRLIITGRFFTSDLNQRIFSDKYNIYVEWFFDYNQRPNFWL